MSSPYPLMIFLRATDSIARADQRSDVIYGGVYLLQQDGAAGRVVRAEIIHADNGLPVACIEVDRMLP